MGLSVRPSVGSDDGTSGRSSHFCDFRVFPGKLLRRLISNLVDTFIMFSFPCLIDFWSHFAEYPPVPSLWFSSSFCAFANKPLIGFRSNLVGQLRPPGTHHRLINSLFTYCFINFWSRPAEFPPFPGLWFVEQFPSIWRQPDNAIQLRRLQTNHWLDWAKFVGPTH